jgi:MFS family permease
MALLCPGLVGVVFGLSETESHGGIGHPIAFAPILAGIVLIGLFVWHSLRVPRPLLELRLFRERGFRAAATTTFLLGGLLFGTLLLLPLYYQVARGESALDAGLLIAPQGIGAALMLPISGRLTDRIGGGPVVVVGCTLVALGTVPFVFVTDHTPYALLGGTLFIRGLGLGASMQPTTAAAYALLDSSQVPRATAALTTVRQIGGSVGTALLVVVLQHEMKASDQLATAFGHTFTWALALALLAIVPAVALMRAERAERAGGPTDFDERTTPRAVRKRAAPRPTTNRPRPSTIDRRSVQRKSRLPS